MHPRVPMGLSILKYPSAGTGLTKPEATQIAHHSSRISVGSIITVAGMKGLRMAIGLRREPRPRPNLGDTYMTRARLGNERGLVDSPGGEGATSPARVGSAGPLRDV